MKKCKKFRCCCCPWDQEKELTILPNVVLWSQSKGIPSAVLSQERRKRGQCCPASPLLPQGNRCKILARKGKSTKCLQILPATVFFQRKGEGLYFHSFPHLSLQLFVPLYKFNKCMYMYMYMYVHESGTLLLPLKLSERWESSWEFPPSFLLMSSTEIFRNSAQDGAEYLSIAKTLTFHSEFNNRQALRHKPG